MSPKKHAPRHIVIQTVKFNEKESSALRKAEREK